MQFTFTASHVQRHAAALLRTELRLKDFGACCPVAALLAVVFAACCRLDSLFAAARRLAAAPSHETVRQALLSNPPDLDTLERRLNHALTADLPRSLTRRRPRLAIIERMVAWTSSSRGSLPLRALRVETSPSTTRRTSFTRSSLAFIASTSFACRSIGGPLCWYVVPIGDCSKVVGERWPTCWASRRHCTPSPRRGGPSSGTWRTRRPRRC